MAQLVTIQQAARNALRTWLASDLVAVTGLSCESRWRSSDELLPAKAISIIDAGPRRIEWLQPEIIASATNAENAAQLDITWSLGYVQQPVQLDVWAKSDVELDDLIARLDRSLNAGRRGAGDTNIEPFDPGVVLNLGDGWAPGIVDFLFEQPQIQQTATSVGEGEWRATYRGRADAMLVQTATSVKLARVKLKARLREVDPIDTADTPDTTTFTIPITD